MSYINLAGKVPALSELEKIIYVIDLLDERRRVGVAEMLIRQDSRPRRAIVCQYLWCEQFLARPKNVYCLIMPDACLWMKVVELKSVAEGAKDRPSRSIPGLVNKYTALNSRLTILV